MQRTSLPAAPLASLLSAMLLTAALAVACGPGGGAEGPGPEAPEGSASEPTDPDERGPGQAEQPMPAEPPDAPWPAPPPELLEPVPTEFRCSGNEPFWSLAIDGAHARWSYPGEEAVEERELSGGLGTLDHLGLAVWRGELEGGALAAFVERRECIDSMSGRASAYTAVLSMPDGGLRTGCCSAAAVR